MMIMLDPVLAKLEVPGLYRVGLAAQADGDDGRLDHALAQTRGVPGQWVLGRIDGRQPIVSPVYS